MFVQLFIISYVKKLASLEVVIALRLKPHHLLMCCRAYWAWKMKELCFLRRVGNQLPSEEAPYPKRTELFS